MNHELALLARALGEERTEAYYVGGCVRDCLLGQPVKDVDLAVAGPTWPLACRLARALDGSPFWLREADQVARVAQRGTALSVDLSPLGGSIADDLLARDLTINSLGIETRSPLNASSPILDPADGRRDLERGVIRFTRPDAVDRDPLRSLRALRFRHRLGFRLARGTTGLIRHGMALLPRVSAERVRDELFLMLEMARAPHAIDEAVRCGLWPTIFPAGASADAPVVGSVLQQALTRLAQVLRRAEPLVEGSPLADYLAEIPIQYRNRLALLRWTLLQLTGWGLVDETAGNMPARSTDWKRLAASGGPLDRAGEALRLSGREQQLVRRAAGGAAALASVVERWPAAGSERLAAFEAARDAEAEAVLLAACETGFRAPTRELLGEALRRHGQPDRPLLDGAEVMQLLGLQPGPEVGRILSELRRAAADGAIGTPEEARAWLLEHYGQKDEG